MAEGDGSGAYSVGFAELGARSNFSLLDGASHPEEMVEIAVALGLAGLAVCDTNSLAGVVRAHAAAKRAGLRFAVGARLLLDDGAEYLVWPADRAAYGRPVYPSARQTKCSLFPSGSRT
jgi:error-prone DNA polymerase